jgi:hypothetical protein
MRKQCLMAALAGSLLLFACNGPAQRKPGSERQSPEAASLQNKIALPDATQTATQVPETAAPVTAGNQVRNAKPSRANSTQSVTVKPTESVFLRGSQGTYVYIAPNSFVLEGSCKEPTGPVTISLQEFQSLPDILQADLSTTSGGRLLETGGMIYLSAAADGQQCALRQGTRAEVTFPGRSAGDGMQLFTGRMVNGKIDWLLQEQPYLRESNGCEGKPRDLFSDPWYPPGTGSLRQFMTGRLDWPDDRPGPITIVDVLAHYEINAEGIAGKPSLEGSISPGFDTLFAEALRRMPRWRPAFCNARPVSSAITQRISFWWPADATGNDVRIKCAVSQPFIDSTYPYYPRLRTTAFTFQTPSLGWINCDRFLEDNRPQVELYVKTDAPADVKLVFHNIRSMMTGELADASTTEAKSVFRNIPRGEPVTAVAFRQEGTQLYFAMAEGNTAAGKIENLVFEKTTKEDALKRLMALDARLRLTASRAARLPPTNDYAFQPSKNK